MAQPRWPSKTFVCAQQAKHTMEEQVWKSLVSYLSLRSLHRINCSVSSLLQQQNKKHKIAPS